MATITSTDQQEVHYFTKDDDVLDLICWNYYGRTNRVVEQVYLRNRETLSHYTAVLPKGLMLVLPQIQIAVDQGYKLWDYRGSVAAKAQEADTKDTLTKVQEALAAYRAKRGSSTQQVVIVRPAGSAEVVKIGKRTRIRSTEDGAVVEVLDDNNVWRQHQEWEEK